MTEPTTDDLARWAALADTDGRLVPVAQYVVDAADAITRLLALVAAQADQIAELTAATRPGDFLPTIRRMKRAEAKIADLKAAAEHWERVMVVVTDQAAEYVATFARVRALCDRLAGDSDPAVDNAAELFRAALDGTEDPA